MLTQKNCFSKLLFPAAVALLMSMALAGKTQDKAASAQKSDSVTPIVLVVPDFKGASDSEVVNLSDGVEQQQEFIRHTLSTQLYDEKLSPVARTQAISLLGNYAPNDETILALIHNINMKGVRPPNDTGFSASRFEGFFARLVLANMGIPVERKILYIIGSQRPTDLQLKAYPDLSSHSFDLSRSEGFADVLIQIKGKQGALSKLQEEQAKAKNPTIQAQFQTVIEVVKKGPARSVNY